LSISPDPNNPIRITVTEAPGGRKLASSGSKWEPVMGYSRAVRVGNTIAVTGTVGINADGSYSPSMEQQARRALQIIVAAVQALGGRPEHIVRTRMFVTDVKRWEEVAKAHGETFARIRPATSILEVARLIDDAALIEIEADAVVA
jgi:enamine deaminase RidA (YjgF/YER057c/UK114 family)